MPSYIPRALGGSVRQALAQFPVVVVTGLRQSGKSTFLRNEPGLLGRSYRTLDDIDQLAAAERDPGAFIRQSDPLTIDEAQKCPQLLPAIKRAVDSDRRPGQFILSGSANFSLLKSISESLAGRAIYFELEPMSRREMAGFQGSLPWIRRLHDGEAGIDKASAAPVLERDVQLGGMPLVRLEEVTDPELWFRGYVQTYLERDVRDLARLTDLVTFRDVLRLASLRGGQLLNASELARDAKVSAPAIARYLGILEASFVIRRVPPYLSNRASRVIKSSKLYLTDSGLAAHLTGLGGGDASSDRLWGSLLETYVAQNLAAILGTEWPGARLHYWHVQGRHEVDFVIESGRHCIALEIKSTARWGERDLAGLRNFLEHTPGCRAAVLAYGGTQVTRLGERLWAVPLGVLLS